MIEKSTPFVLSNPRPEGGLGEFVDVPANDIITEGDLEIELADDGSVEIDLSGAQSMDNYAADIAELPFNANLAEHLPDDVLMKISCELQDRIDDDKVARQDWVEAYVAGLEQVGLKYEERTEPWEGACGVHSTLLLEAAIRFQAESISETFPAIGPVKTKILGEETPEKRAAAERVRADMNHELTDVMYEYRPEHERLLYNLGLVGSAFKKLYYDPILRRQTAKFVPAEDILVPYGASHIDTADRVTHILKLEKSAVEDLQYMGVYKITPLYDAETPTPSDVEEAKAKLQGMDPMSDDRVTLYEVHTRLRIPGVDGAPLDDSIVAEDNVPVPQKPYIVTMLESTGEVIGLYRAWREDDPHFTKVQSFVHYGYVPGDGFYCYGLIHIVGGHNRASTALTRMLIDAGTLSNLPGGYKTRDFRVVEGDKPISPGEFRDVDVTSGALKDNIVPLPFKEPSQTLLALRDKINEEGRKMGAVTDVNVSDMGTQAPVGTTLALLERSLKPLAAVQARVHFAMKREFAILKELIAEHAAQQYNYVPQGGEQHARAEDYAMVEVIPVSDPNSTTMAQRVVVYQTAMMMAKDAPQIYDQKYLHRQMLETIGIPNADKIVPLPDDMIPVDPITENMSLMTGKPAKAFLHQDHEAHIKAHMSCLQDPQVAQVIGQSPQAQAVAAAFHAHMAEHAAYRYRKQVEVVLGVPLPAPGEELPEMVEVHLSQLVGDASTQLTQQHAQQQAQMEAQAKAQDPEFQLRQREVEIQEKDIQRKVAKDQMDFEIDKARVAIDAKKVTSQNIIAKRKQDDDRSNKRTETRLKAIKQVYDSKKAGEKDANNRTSGAKKPDK